ncbi:MAG TPA: protein kinase [Anaerolineales bacterium]|nr:protein kinase [Anaerolineales bacterium]
MIGQKLNNRYTIITLLGEGGMGEVFLAADGQTGQQVAVKILSRQLSAKPEALERFRREAETLRQLDHPNIVKFVDAFEHEAQFVIVMEYLPGGSLHDEIKAGPMPIDRALRITLELSDALIRSHYLNIVHRDIKPENVLLGKDGRPKLADFGVARLQEGTRMTRTGTQVGTPYYMSPEAWEGKPLDAQTDIWSLGVMFFEMLAGQVPFGGDTGAAVMNKVLTAPPPDLKKMRDETPPGLARIVSKMLTRDKRKRYQTMRQVAVDLESGSRTTKLSPAASSYAIPFAIGTVTVIGIAIVGILALNWKSIGLIPASTQTPLPSPTFELTPEQARSPTPPPTQTSSPSGQWIAFNSRVSGNADIYLVDIRGNNLTQVTTSSSHDLYPSWSPDGKKIVFQTNDGGDQELAIVTISNKRTEGLTDNNCNDWGPVWSTVDSWIVFYSDCDGERNIYKIREDGSRRTQLTFSSGSYSWFPSWSPDGKKITFSSNRSGKYRIYVMNANGENEVELVAGCVSFFSPDGKRILYGVYCDDTSDLFLMNADGSEQARLTDGCECKNATWSPDGKSIVFQLSQTTKEGPFQLYIMSLDKPERSNWVLLTNYDVNGGSPVWQP